MAQKQTGAADKTRTLMFSELALTRGPDANQLKDSALRADPSENLPTANLPRVTFVLATLNESRRIDKCLSSIRAQDYPQALVDILIADAASIDDTRAKCLKYGAQVFDNPLIRCEPGVALLIDKVRDGLIVVCAADNAFGGSDWLKSMTSAFSNKQVVAAFCSVAHDRTQGCFANRYLNRFTDPYNHFIYWSGADYANLATTHWRWVVGIEAGKTYFRFDAGSCPLIALAQGVMIRAPYSRPQNLEEDDVTSFAALAANGNIAYVEGVRVEHSSVLTRK